MLTKHPANGLYAITDEHLIAASEFEQSVLQAIANGASIIQYRNKQGDAALRLAQAQLLRRLCSAQGVLLIINDDCELAVQVQADGVHIGRHDDDYAAARAQLGDSAIIGISCYASLQRAEAAQQAGADYVAFGRFFPSSTKPEAAPASLDDLRQASAVLTIPIVAIGGITPENGSQLIEAGADYLAVINGLFGADDIGLAARQYSKLFNQD